MTGMNGWSTQTDFNQWMRDTGRDIAELKRRGRPTAQQILGPGLGPWATLLIDWNDEITLYNGILYSEVGSTNSPDNSRRWIGTSNATPDGAGVMNVWDLDAAESPDHYVRTFATDSAGGVVYGDWEFVGGGGSTGGGLAPVKAAATWNLVLSGEQSVDLIPLVDGDRVLAAGETVTADNGVWIVHPGPWTRADDANTPDNLMPGTSVKVLGGYANELKTFTQSAPISAVGVSPQVWRVLTYTDMGDVFGYPTPQGTGQQYVNTTNKVMAVWDGGQWINLSNVFICTSTTRPGFAIPGQIIYETDTGRTFIWNGSAWAVVGGRNVSGATSLGLTGISSGSTTYQVSNGWVYVEGNVTFTASLAVNATLAFVTGTDVLPPEFRPSVSLWLPGRSSSGAPAQILRAAGGGISVQNVSSAAITSVQFQYSYPVA